MSGSAKQPSDLVMFIAGQGRDGAGRMFDEVLAMSDADLERHHDYIQWLFPLPTPSGALPGSPIMTEADRLLICSDPMLIGQMQRALDRITAFFVGNTHWLVFHNHNHLRITRIISSVGLLIGPEAAHDFHQTIVARVRAMGGPVSPVSQRYWREAAQAVGGIN
jgi:hypothetical protein